MCSAFQCADGSIANLTYTTAGSRTFTSERVEVFAPGVSAVAEDFKRLTARGSTSRSGSHWFPDKGHRAQLEGFFRAVREHRQPEVTVRDGARATVGCLRMLQSARTLAPASIDWQSAVT
jgi:hypothetical protein